MLHKKCIVCCGDLFNESLLQFKNIPESAQKIPTRSEVDNENGIDLELFQCTRCGLVQFNCEPVSYYKDVIRAGGYSSTMQNIRREQYVEFINTFKLEGKKILEVGSGQGEFLKVLTEFNVNVFGIEHSEKLVNDGINNGLNIIKGFVERPDYEIPNAPYDAFLSFNFLEHQPDPNGMLQGIFNNLVPEGVGLVTVPSLEYIIKHEGYYEFIRDHLAYFTEESLKFLMQNNGFEVIKCTLLNRDTLSIFVKKRTRLDLSQLNANFSQLKLQLNLFVDSYIENGKKVAIWGASHQGFTLIAVTGLADRISYIIDSAPFKQNRYAPASHVPIVSPEYYFEHPVDCIIIVAPGYSDEILSIIKQKFKEGIGLATLKSNRLEIIRE